MKTVEIIVKPDGSVKVTYEGFQGQACFQEARRIYAQLRRLGVDVEVEKVLPTTLEATASKTKVTNRA